MGTIFIPVSNIERARDWYCDLLGLSADGEILFGHLYVLPMNGTGIVLDSKIFSNDHIYKTPAFHLNSENIEEAYEYVKKKEIEITTAIEHQHYFNIKDPDGNVIMVCKC